MTRCPRCHDGDHTAGESEVSLRLCPEHALAVLTDLRARLRTSAAARTRRPKSEDGVC
ncbi:MAG TPA: hypothetical protein VGL09_10985 [Methylomirabilota bacterium]